MTRRRRLPVWAWVLAGIAFVAIVVGAALLASGRAAQQKRETALATAQQGTALALTAAANDGATRTARVRVANQDATAAALTAAANNTRTAVPLTLAANAKATSTARAAAQVRATSTALARATQQKATSTALARATQQKATQTAVSVNATTQSALATLKTLPRAAGPLSGSMPHDDDGYIENYSAGVSVASLLVEATFYNPYPSSAGTWSNGFQFRHTGDSFYAAWVTSGGRWCYSSFSKGTWAQNTCEPSEYVNVAPSGSNVLRLLAVTDVGDFWVNDHLMGVLDLSAQKAPGDVFATTGLSAGDEIPGKATRFDDLTVWSLDQ